MKLSNRKMAGLCPRKEYFMSENATPPPTLTGAQIAVRLLERQGIRWIPGIPGGSILPF